jgi:hypothetical protein
MRERGRTGRSGRVRSEGKKERGGRKERERLPRRKTGSGVLGLQVQVG